jgi:hypothetical protein
MNWATKTPTRALSPTDPYFDLRRMTRHFPAAPRSRLNVLVLSALAIGCTTIGLGSPLARGGVQPTVERAMETKTWIGIFPRLYEPGVDASYYRRPHRFRLVSADSTILFKGLHWHKWGSRRAVARGHARTCGEGGIDGFVCATGPVRLAVGHIGSCPTGGDLYQSLVAFGVPLYGRRTDIPVLAESCGPPRRCVGPVARCGEAPRTPGHTAYLACDDASRPDYPFLRAAPRSCALGLRESPFDAQPVSGHRLPRAITLTNLRWRRWGYRVAKARGRVCEINLGRCQRARVIASRPVRVLPAGNRPIYQRIRVRHLGRGDGSYTDWYQPGTDY